MKRYAVCRYHNQRVPEGDLTEADGMDGTYRPTHTVKENGMLRVEAINLDAAAMKKAKFKLREWPICCYGGELTIRIDIQGKLGKAYWTCSVCTLSRY